MTRRYSHLVNPEVQELLNTLVSRSSEPSLYREAMMRIGLSFGDAILAEMNNKQCSVYLACTVEDADFLAQGILSRIEKSLDSVAFACFWNQRFSPFNVVDLKVAPILKKYQEPTAKKVDYLVIVKSIISGACVVKTNLTHLIQEIDPEKIFIVAPVIFHRAEQKLKNEFIKEIYDKFHFFYFAKDDERTSEGVVIPGIGGTVYDRLGFDGQDDKNKYVPQIVKSRRSKFVNV